MAERADIGEIVDLVKTYAKQETIDPLRNTARYLARGLAGAFFIGIGLVLLLVGLLRLLQTETDAFEDGWSWVPYLIVVVVGSAIAGLFLSRITKGGLDG